MKIRFSEIGKSDFRILKITNLGFWKPEIRKFNNLAAEFVTRAKGARGGARGYFPGRGRKTASDGAAFFLFNNC